MIEITHYKPNPNSSALIASFTATYHKMGGIEIREIKLFRKDDKAWLQMPSREYEVDGKKKYFPFVAFKDAATNEAFKGKTMDAVIKHIESLGQQTPKPQEEQGELPF